MFLYENGNNKYFYEVFIETDTNGECIGIRIDLVFRTLNPYSQTVIILNKNDFAKLLNSKIDKIVEKHFKAHVDYKGEPNPNIKDD